MHDQKHGGSATQTDLMTTVGFGLIPMTSETDEDSFVEVCTLRLSLLGYARSTFLQHVSDSCYAGNCPRSARALRTQEGGVRSSAAEECRLQGMSLRPSEEPSLGMGMGMGSGPAHRQLAQLHQLANTALGGALAEDAKGPPTAGVSKKEAREHAPAVRRGEEGVCAIL